MTDTRTNVYLSDQHRAAVRYTARGWNVLPLNGKIPATSHGLHDATTSLETVDRWWWQWPAANIGIAIPVRRIVLDIDPRHGGDASLDKLTSKHGPLPPTLTAVTGRGDGGRHIWLLHPGGPLTDLRIGDGIDLRAGERHYIVAPPSRHPDTGGTYRWANSARIVPPPAWLTSLLRPATQPARPMPHHQTGTPDRGAGLIRHVATAEPGNRNATVFWAACRAAADGLLPELAEQLVSAAVGAGLAEHEARRTIRSADRRAM